MKKCKMMRLLIGAAMATMATVGCQKLQGIFGQDTEPVDDGAPVKITFNTNVLNVETKANGSVTEFTNDHKLYVYGIKSDGTVLMNNVEATAAGVTAPVQGTGGVQKSLVITSGYAYFYTGTKDEYSFYGYYVDDAAGTDPAPDPTSYTLPVTITGDQDILLAKADPEKDCEGNDKVYYKAVPEEGKINDPVYSAWSARRGVVPTLKFEHQLSQFTFTVKNSGGIDVTLEGITINTTNQGTLTVVGADPNLAHADNAKADLPLKMDALALTAKGDYKQVQYTAGESKFNSSMMVFPGVTNTLVLTLKQEKQNGLRTVSIPITQATEKGYSYEVQITVYSMEEVAINVTLAEWETGQAIPIDTESYPGVEDVYTPNV